MRKCKCCTDFRNMICQFNFEPLESADPPDSKGVYILRVKNEGKSVDDIIRTLSKTTTRIYWPQVREYLLGRIGRLNQIAECDILYIGCGGRNEESKNTLKKRYQEFASRHTIQFPLWALLYFGWKIEYGWLKTKAPWIVEAELKKHYKSAHGNKLPPLVLR
jgi:hypothetical protein